LRSSSALFSTQYSAACIKPQVPFTQQLHIHISSHQQHWSHIWEQILLDSISLITPTNNKLNLITIICWAKHSKVIHKDPSLQYVQYLHMTKTNLLTWNATGSVDLMESHSCKLNSCNPMKWQLKPEASQICKARTKLDSENPAGSQLSFIQKLCK
jgi:hypothetical protein